VKANRDQDVKFQVTTGMVLGLKCSLLQRHRRFGRTCYIYLEDAQHIPWDSIPEVFDIQGVPGGTPSRSLAHSSWDTLHKAGGPTNVLWTLVPQVWVTKKHSKIQEMKSNV